MGFSFDGVDDRLKKTVTNFASGWTEYTIASWIKSDVSGNDKGWCNLAPTTSNDSYGGIRYDVAGVSGGGTNVMKFGVLIGASQIQCESASSVQTTSLQHVVGRWKSNAQAELWIDGSITAHTFQTAAKAGSIDNGNNEIVLGAGPKDGAGGGWDGDIYEVRVYNRWLSQEEIETLYNTRGTDNIVQGLELKYGKISGSFGGTIPTTSNLIKDLSGNGNHLTASGNPKYADNPIKYRK